MTQPTQPTQPIPPKTQVPNPKWHDLKQNDGYAPNLIINTKISVTTNIGNDYNFYKYENAVDGATLDNLWVHQKNGVWQMKTATPDDYQTLKIEVLDDLISWMYSIIDPVTGQNLEKPTKIIIN